MRIIVLGASGQIGSIIYDGLKKTHQVIGTSRKPSTRFTQFDPFRDDWSSLGKAEVLINCVGQIETSGSRSFYHIHVEMTKRIIEHREKVGNPCIIQISALGASAEHKVEFLRTKGIADKLLLEHQNTTLVRPSIVCTHRTMIVRKMLMLFNMAQFSFGFVPLPTEFLQTRIQPIMPQDLVELVATLCLHHEHRIVHAVGPEPLTFSEIISMMLETRNQNMRLIGVSRKITDRIMKNFICPVLPKVINIQQYQLLFEDNVADAKMVEQLVGHSLISARKFFKDEFSHARN